MELSKKFNRNTITYVRRCFNFMIKHKDDNIATECDLKIDFPKKIHSYSSNRSTLTYADVSILMIQTEHNKLTPMFQFYVFYTTLKHKNNILSNVFFKLIFQNKVQFL